MAIGICWLLAADAPTHIVECQLWHPSRPSPVAVYYRLATAFGVGLARSRILVDKYPSRSPFKLETQSSRLLFCPHNPQPATERIAARSVRLVG